MSNQYYNFLNKELLKYFKNSYIKPGDRYFLILNSDSEINSLKYSIENSKENSVTKFYSEEFSFESIYYKLNDIKVIFIFTNEGITHDFLVTIRNKVSLQKDEWKNSVVVFMIKEDLDSITGGAFDLSKKGAPFHTSSLRNNLSKILKNSDNELASYESSILEFIVSTNFEDDLIKYTLMDFESVYSIIEQGNILDNDYLNLGLFKDKQLDTFTDKEIEKRLIENKNLFETVQSIHDRGNIEEQIKDKFDGKASTKLQKEDWHKSDFETVKRSKEAMDSLKKVKLDFLEEDFQSQFKNIEVWDRPSGKSKAKLKERNIIIFKNNIPLKSILLPFSKTTDINSNYVINRGIKLLNLTKNSVADVSFKNKNKSNLLVDLSSINIEDDYYFEFSYRHNNNSSLTFKFRILLVNFDSRQIETLKTKYKLKYDKSLKKVEINLDNSENLLSFNEQSGDYIKVQEVEEEYSLEKNNKFDFSPLVSNDEDQIYIFIIINNIKYKIKLNDFVNKPIPVSSTNLIRYVYEKKESMKTIDNLAIQGTNEFYLYNDFKNAIQIEKSILQNKYTNGSIIDDEFIGEKLELNPDIEEAYKEFCDLLIYLETVPSLMYYDNKIAEASIKYYSAVESVLNSLPDNEKIINKTILNIHKLGIIKHDNKIYMTAFHPLLIKYELEKSKYFNENNINDKIFKKYNPTGLLPYYVDSNSNFYFSNYTEENARWLTYKPFESTNKMSADKVRFVIKSRLQDFKSHFSYLFEINSEFALKSRFVEINDHKVILQGSLEYLLDELKNSKTLNKINPINIYLDESSNNDRLYEFYNITSYNDLFDLFDIKIPNNVRKNFEEDDVIDILKSKTNLFIDKGHTVYHITFYNFNQEPKFSINNLREINASVTEKGLLSSISYTKLGSTYLSGFGIAGIKEESDLIMSALLWNGFVSSNQNHQLNPYKVNSGIVNNIISLENQNLHNVFDNTNWVTFLDPSVDLSYFNNDEFELYVIHYNDQTSSFNYESITVTNDTHQYSNILKEFLDKVNINYNPSNIENIIRSFNILNGEWLLNVIGNRSARNPDRDHSVREKLSIISAYKQVLAILDNKEIQWIPISLEEILRVSRQQGLESSSDIFSAKELKHQGSISDDLLFIGLEYSKKKTKVHLMPIEVKVGINNSNVIEKAKSQVTHLFKLIEKELITTSNKILTQNYYRQFFLNIYFGNVKKFIENGVLTNKELINIFNNRAQILNSDVFFTSELNQKYGNGFTLFFTEGNTFRKLIKDDERNILEVHFTELDAYKDAEKDYETIKKEIHENKKGIDITKILSNYKGANNYKVSDNPIESMDSDNSLDEVDIEKSEKSNDIEPTVTNLESTRILLGNIKGSTQKLFWEYGNPKLPNRHLLISGKSGQGKTYFMQCLLYEMAQNNLDSLIVDYTDGFLENHLEKEFLTRLGGKLETKFIFKDKLPINPFKKNEIDLGGFTIPEENDDIADRVVQIIDFVFKLGIQQSSLLKVSIKSGLDIYGENFTFTKLKQQLLDDDTSNTINLVGRMSKLLDKDPFVYSNNDFTWDKVFNSEGKVQIMQLKGFVPDIQKIITEFLLWDLYNFSERKGEKNSPIPVLLDEMQNLNHKESSPITKILKEGRKFGWSSWLATQSISSIKNNNGDISALFNAAQQIHFAPPEDQIPFISKNISTNSEERRRIEQELSSLNKGECIVNGYSYLNGQLKKIVETIEVTPLEYRD
ncbi:helicase HerA domain-containing protein [Mammaliicoccus fleurettii]|uniref:helicase HerA domain-containing protein n=1 Tax=Mammaliicoccus fleurettii TaxID=150056 RepID=UPI001AAC73FC|nr:DUF87 domain-containing protein [Mammaliicoccus fleurettii]MBO3061352.1 DUF87 domain-containing protein [Mammaliicoccus fleurettii]